MHYKFTLVFLFLFTCCGFGQNAVHKFFVTNQAGVPIADATVQSANGSFITITSDKGMFELIKTEPATTKLRISRIGYQTLMVDVNNLPITNGAAVVIMQSKISSLQDVTLTSLGTKNFFKTISDFDIHLRPLNNSQEVLRIIPGLFIGQHAGGGKAEQLFLRGFDLDHGTDINITVDGMPVNMVSHAHGQGYADLHFVIPELIDKVNFNKGTYYAEKGNFTTAGFADFKTRDYLDKNFFKIEAGQFGNVRNVFALNLLKSGRKVNQPSLYVAGEAFYSKGYFDNPQNFSRLNSTIKYHSNLGANSNITALVSGFTSRWDASGQIPEREVMNGNIGFFGAIDPNEGGNTSRYNASINIVSKLKNSATIQNQVFYTNYNFQLFSNFTFFREDSINGDQIKQKENRNILGYNGSYKQDYTIGRLQAQTTVGAQVRHDVIKNIELSRTSNKVNLITPLQLGDINETNLAAYVSQQVSPLKNVNVTAGVRFDYFINRYADQLTNTTSSTTAPIVSPKLNLDIRINKNVQLYWYNGKGFHSNDTRVAVPQNGRKVLPPALSSDIGGIFKLGSKTVLQTAVWYLWLDQEFIYVGDEGVIEAGGRSKRVGADASLRYEVVKNLFANIDVNYASPKALGVSNLENKIPLAPKLTTLGGLVYRKQKGLNGSLLYRYMGNRPANEDGSIIAKGYFLLDIATNYTTKRWEAGIAIQNLLNTRWKETQFATESRLLNEPGPVNEIHFTPGSPFFARLHLLVNF